MLNTTQVHAESPTATKRFVNKPSSSTTWFSNPLHTPPFWLNIFHDVSKLKWYNTHILHNYTLQIDFLVWPMLWVTVEESGYQHTHLTNWSSFTITLVLFTILWSESTIPDPIQFFFFEGPKLLLNLVSFTCSCSPINFTMEQKGQP